MPYQSAVEGQHITAPPATERWLSCYLRGRQAKTCFRGVKSTSRKVNTGVLKGSKLSPSLFSFYIADMPRPTELVKRVCNADDLEDSINCNLDEITAHQNDYSLLISAPKSPVRLFIPDPHQSKTHPIILKEDSQLPLVQCQNILGVYIDTFLSFNKHSDNVAERVSSRKKYPQGLSRYILGTTYGDTTYDLQNRWEIDHHLAAPAWSTNLRHTNYRNIQYTQNEALRIVTSCHKLFSVDHLHVEPKMLKVLEHSELLSAQYLARCLEPGNVCHSITTRETPKRRMKQTLFTRHCNTVEPIMLADNRKATLQAIHTDAVNKPVKDQEENVVLDDLPQLINNS